MQTLWEGVPQCALNDSRAEENDDFFSKSINQINGELEKNTQVVKQNNTWDFIKKQTFEPIFGRIQRLLCCLTRALTWTYRLSYRGTTSFDNEAVLSKKASISSASAN